jgi:hypothetical protein
MRLLLGVVLLAMGAQVSSAEPSVGADVEIGKLLSALGASKCEFYRNGSWHYAVEAQAHLTKKYEYLRDKKKVTTTERFIADAGSKSSMSGETYQVRCPGRAAEPSAKWLSDELTRLRQERRP